MEERKYIEHLIAQQNRLQMWIILLMILIMIFLVVAIFMSMGMIWWLDEHDIFSRVFAMANTTLS